MKVGGIILAGGRSRRMGVAKAMLPFGPETLLQRVARLVGEAVSPIVVVAATGQELPVLDAHVLVVRDRLPGHGPLEGIAAGWRALTNVEAAYVSACDTPLVKPQFICRIIELLDSDHQATVPVIDEFPQPLTGVYRSSAFQQVDQMLAAGQLRLMDWLPQLSVRWLDAKELIDVDPELESLRNLNSPHDYQAALAAAGFADENQFC